MKTFSLFFLAASLLAQTNFPRLSGSNPSVDLGTTTYNVGTTRVFTGSGAPSNPTPLVTGVPAVRGDLYQDTSNNIFYTCAAATCTSANNWTRAAYPSVVSVTAFGVNGSPSDATNLQVALNAASGNFCLYIPSGLTVNMAGNTVNLPNTCISGDGPTLSKVQSTGLATPNVGVWNILASDTNVSITGIGFDGNVTTPVGVLYSTATSGGPQQSLFTTGSMFWVHSPASGISFKNDLIQHTGGYAIYSDASFGIIKNMTIDGCTFQNNRPFLFGTSALIYGSWTGGVLFYTSGSFPYQNLVVNGNTFQNDTGNALWFHTNVLAGNRSQMIRVTNNTGIDLGLDFIQVAEIDGLVETGNKSIRVGYVITSDVGATRVGGPLWLQNFTPVAYDMAGTVSNFVISDNVADTMNGEGIDLDGAYQGTVSGNMVISCWGNTSDLLANSGSCGPSGNVGNNFALGMSANNSSNQGAVGFFLTLVSNTLINVGDGGMALYGIQSGIISGNNIYMPQTAHGSPITLGNLVGKHATFNVVTANTINWTPLTGSPAVFEDGNTFEAFSPGDRNIVFGNNLNLPLVAGGELYEFQKATPDISGTGPVYAASVTAGAPVATQAFFQSEGTTNSSFAAKIYGQVNGTGIGQLFQAALVGITPRTTTFSALGSASTAGVGTFIYCTDCTPGATCTGSGSGHMATSNGTIWQCQ